MPATSFLTARSKVALAEAKTWLAVIGAVMLATMAFTSDRDMSVAQASRPFRQQMPADQCGRLTPALVFAFGIFEVAPSQVFKGVGAALSPAFGCRVLAFPAAWKHGAGCKALRASMANRLPLHRQGAANAGGHEKHRYIFMPRVTGWLHGDSPGRAG